MIAHTPISESHSNQAGVNRAISLRLRKFFTVLSFKESTKQEIRYRFNHSSILLLLLFIIGVTSTHSQISTDSLHLEILSVEIQKAQLQVEETNFWHRLLPQIQFLAGFSTKDMVFLDPTNASYQLPKDSYRLSVSLSISDIFDGSKHENAKLNLTKLQLDYEQTKQRQAALRQQHQNQLCTTIDIQKNLEESLKLKEDILRFNELLFKQGKIEYDVLLKSKLDLLTAQNSIIQLKQRKHDLQLPLPNGANNE